MNNNLGMRKILIVAACTAIIGCTGGIAHSQIITIDKMATADGISGTLTNIETGMPPKKEYDWVFGTSSNTALLTGGNLTVSNYTSDIINDTIVGTSGWLNVDSGTLTINSGSSIANAVITNTLENTSINIIGGNVSLDSDDTIDGSINIANGNLNVNRTSIKGGLTQTGGTTNIENSSKSASSQLVVSGGKFNINSGSYDLNNDGDRVSKGTLNLGQGTGETVLNVSKGEIESEATVNIAKNSTINVSGGDLTLDNTDNWNGTVNVSGGNLALVGINKNANSKLTQSGGSTTILGDFDLNNASDIISGGDLNIGDSENESYLTVSKGTIDKSANVNLTANSTLEITGGNVSLDGATDTWSGALGISQGTLNLSSMEKDANAIFIQSGGTTNITGSGFSLNNGLDEIAAGKLNVGTDAETGNLNINGGTISQGATVNLTSGSSIKLTNGNINLDSDDTWGGKIEMSGGNLNIQNTTKTGSLNQIDGTTNITGNKFDLNNTSDLIDGGIVNIGNGETASRLNVSQGTITADATVNINEKATLNVNGGNVTLNNDDVWNGNVNVSGGSLALVGMNKTTGTFTQTGGSTTITGKTFDLNNDNDYIAGGDLNIGDDVIASEMSVSKGSISKDTNVNITNNSALNVNGGNVEIGSGGQWNGKINISSGNLTLDNAVKNQSGSFTQTGGKTTVVGNGVDFNNYEDSVTGGTLNIGNGTTESNLKVSQGYIDSAATVNINRKGQLSIAGGEVNLDSGDSLNGSIEVTDGTLSIDNLNKNSSGKFTQSGGKTTITGDYFELNNSEDKISGGTLNIGSNSKAPTTFEISQGKVEQGAKVNINNGSTINVTDTGTLTLDNSDSWNGNVNVTGGNLALVGINNKNGIFTQSSGTTTVTESGFDLNNAEDIINGGTLNIGDGTKVSDMSVSQGKIGSNTTVNIKKSGSLNVTGGEVNLNNKTTWNGNVNVSSGTLNIDSAAKNESGKFIQNDGTTTITGSGFNLNNSEDSVAGGTFNIGNGTTVTDIGVSKGTIHAGAVTNINTNSTLNISGGKVNLNDNDNWNGKVNMTGGSLALVGINKSSDAILTQTGGTTTVNGAFDLNNIEDNISGGNFNIGTDSEESILTVSKGTIGKNTALDLASNSSINITGGNVTFSDNDNWNGNVNLSNGNLNLAGINKNTAGILTQTGGKTTVTGKNNTLNNESDTISGGELVIGTKTDSGELNIEKGKIESAAAVTINETGTLNVKGGTTTLDGENDRINGSIKVSNGILNLNNKFNKTTTSVSKFNQNGGTTNIDNAKLVLNTSESKISGGTINLSQTAELDINNSSQNSSTVNSTGGKFSIRKGSKYSVTDGTIDENSAVTVEENAQLEVNGTNSNITLDGKNDDSRGHLKVTNGTLNLKNGFSKTTTDSGTFSQTGGVTNITDSSLTLADNNSKISDGEINVSGNSELNIANGHEHTSRLNITGSKFNIRNKSTYTTTGGKINSDAVVTVESASKLKIDGEDAEVNLNGTNDKIDGSIALKKGNLYISEDLTKVTDAEGNYVQTGGSMTMNKSSLTLADESSVISGGNVKLQDKSILTVSNKGGDITGGNIVIDDTSVLNYLASKGLVQFTDGNAINIDTSGLINMANNVRTNSIINNLTVNNGEFGNGTANFAIDIQARSNKDFSTDTITANSIKVATKDTAGTIRISDYNLNGDIFGYDAPIDRHIRLGKIFKTDEMDKEIKFESTDKEIFTPIGYYRLNASSANDGNYSLDLARYNPQVFRGQVQSAAAYMNQLVINDTLFNRAQIRRYGSSYDDMFKNKTAIIDGSASYERTIRDGQIWTEMFGNFETLKMSQGLDKVRNNSWGFIVGGDFGLRELKNGWSWMPTAYIAYNGGHQTFNKVGMWQNGAQAGFMGSFWKQNFTETALAYAGIYGTEMNVAGTSEDGFNYFFGAASRSAYDWKLGSHFKIQPSLTLAYNMFGQQNWHSDFGQMSMTAGFLNGFNVAPGVNFILQQESWSMYATISYAWNFFGGLDGQAGNVSLPHLKMSQGYLQYGFGMQKAFNDRFNMYAQATIRNIGRTGIICQGGMNWRL